jgi:hypothetical protein
MKNKDNILEVKADFDDLMCMFGGALRYGLGRQTYMPSLVVQVITDNIALYNKKWIVNLLNDLTRYEKDIESGWLKDEKHNFGQWMRLKHRLFQEYTARGYTVPLGE